MIKVAFIAPTKLIPEYGLRGDIQLVLSHLLDQDKNFINEYEINITQQGIFTGKQPLYLDNGLFENKVAEPIDVVLAKARDLKAEYLFAPDVLFNREATEQSVIKTIERMKEKQIPNLKLAAIVQADNPTDWIESYKTLVALEGVSMIGLSILSIPESFKSVTGTDDITENRLYCLMELLKLDQHKPCHLLGAGSSYRDVAFAAEHCKFVESHDSSSAIWNGLELKTINPDTYEVLGGKSTNPVDFNWDQELTDLQKEAIEHNIQTVLKITQHAN